MPNSVTVELKQQAHRDPKRVPGLLVPFAERRNAKPILAFAAAILLAACGREQAPGGAAPAADIKTATVEMRDVELTYSAEAVIEAVRQSTVSAQVAGRIVDLRFDVGDTVKKGEVIARIDERAATQALEASEAQVRQAEAELRNARAQYERARQLVAQKFMSPAALDTAEADFKAAQARVTIVPSADPRTHTMQVRLELAAEARGVYPGVYARAHFITGKAPRLLVPRPAVLQRSEATVVYVLDERGALQLRQVRLGAASDERSLEVLSGLRPGERVAIEPVKAGIEGGRSAPR